MFTGIVEQKPRHFFNAASGFTGVAVYLRNHCADIDNNLFIAGNSITAYRGVSAINTVKIKPNFDIDTSFVYGTGFNSAVYDCTITPNKDIVYGTTATQYNGTTIKYGVCKVDQYGAIYTAYGNGLTSGFNNLPHNIQSDDNGDIYYVGRFTTFNGSTANRIIKLNGTTGEKDTSFDNSTGFNGIASCVVISKYSASKGKIYVSGAFTQYKGVAANGIIRLNTDGSKDTNFDNSTGFAGGTIDVHTICEDETTGKIYVGGAFTSYKGTNAYRLVCINNDGTHYTTFDTTSAFNNPAMHITMDKNRGVLYINGYFTNYKGTTANNLVSVNMADASINTTFAVAASAGDNNVYKYHVLDTNGDIIMGYTTKYNNVTYYNIIKLDYTGTVMKL